MTKNILMVLNFPSNYKWFISETVSCLRSQWWSLLEFQALPPVAGFLSTILFHLCRFLNLWFSSLGWNTTFGLTGFSWIKILCVIKDKKSQQENIDFIEDNGWKVCEKCAFDWILKFDKCSAHWCDESKTKEKHFLGAICSSYSSHWFEPTKRFPRILESKVNNWQ